MWVVCTNWWDSTSPCRWMHLLSPTRGRAGCPVWQFRHVHLFVVTLKLFNTLPFFSYLIKIIITSSKEKRLNNQYRCFYLISSISSCSRVVVLPVRSSVHPSIVRPYYIVTPAQAGILKANTYTIITYATSSIKCILM